MLRQESEVDCNRDVGFVPVRDDALAPAFGQLCKPQELGDTPNHGHIWLRDIDPADVEHLPVFGASRKSQISAADRHAEALKASMPFEIIQGQRRLNPREVVLFEERHQWQALLRPCPGSRSIYHQPTLLADMLPSSADELRS